jgi:hypothetical protein
MPLSDLKMQARAALHGAMSEPASVTLGGVTYPTVDQIAAGLSLTVRWHNRMTIQGERSADDIGIVEGINKIVFNVDQLAALGLVLERNATVDVPGYGKSFQLDAHEEPDGPLNDYWSVIEL